MDTEVVVKKTKYDDLQDQINKLSAVVEQQKKDFDDLVSKIVDLKVEVIQLNTRTKDNAFVKAQTAGTTIQEYLGDASNAEPMIVGGAPVDATGRPFKAVFDEKKFIKPQREIQLP